MFCVRPQRTIKFDWMVYELWGCSNHFNDMLLLWRRLEVTCCLTASVLWTVGHVSMATDKVFSLFQWHHAGEARLSETESALCLTSRRETQLFTHNALLPFPCLTIPLILYTRQNYKDFWALMRRTCRSAEITACHSHKQTVLLYTDIISIHYIWGPAQLIFIIKHWHDDYLNDFTNTFIRILSAVLLMCLSVLYVVCLYLSVKVRLQSGLTQKPTLI